MGRLDDIPKKNIFSVPESYFDTLPDRLQLRIASASTGRTVTPAYQYAVRYAVAVAAVILLAIIFYLRPSSPDTQAVLATMDTASLVEYLEESGIDTDDLLENIEFEAEEVEAIENEIHDADATDFYLDDVEDETNLTLP
jgi:hypothetical protein